MAGWWAETMEVPSVLSDPEAMSETASDEGCEFMALSTSIWQAADPESAIAGILRRLGGE